MIIEIREDAMLIKVQFAIPDDFFDCWMKHGKVETIGLFKGKVRFVMVDNDIYYCLDDALRYIKDWKTRDVPLYDFIYETFPGISADQAKDLFKEYEK